MEPVDQGGETRLVVPGAVDPGSGRVDVDVALPHLDDVHAVAHRRGGEGPDDLPGIPEAHGVEHRGGALVAVTVAGQPGVGPVLDRIPEDQDEAGEALEGDPEAEDHRQPPMDRQGGSKAHRLVPPDGRMTPLRRTSEKVNERKP